LSAHRTTPNLAKEGSAISNQPLGEAKLLTCLKRVVRPPSNHHLGWPNHPNK